MNQTIETILTRRSIRTFTAEPISAEHLDLIVQAGLYAPSAMGLQARHLCVIRSPKAIRELDRELKRASKIPGFDRFRDYVASENYSINYTTAPVFVIASREPDAPKADCAAALENMFLAAHSLGLASCWINQLQPVEDEPAFRARITRLGVPERYRIAGAACFGHPAAPAPQPVPRRDGAFCIVDED